MKQTCMTSTYLQSINAKKVKEVCLGLEAEANGERYNGLQKVGVKLSSLYN